MPRVSVLMTTFNGAAFIGASIASVLSQTLPDFELIVVDDGSTDATPDILHAIDDTRLRVIRQDNAGIVAARNVGFSVARGDYLAALDHDDLSHPERLARQVAFLDAHLEIVLVGTEVRLASADGVVAPHHPGAGDPLALRWQMLVDNPLTWSSVMLRCDAVRRMGAFLRPEFELADDFDLYHRLLIVGEIARLPEVLTTYRYHAGNASLENAARLDARAASILAGSYRPWLGDDATRLAEVAVPHWLNRRPPRDAATLALLGDGLARLLAGFCAPGAPGAATPERVAALAGETWWRTVRSATRAGAPELLRQYSTQRNLTAQFRPKRADVAMSLGAGLARWAGRRCSVAGAAKVRLR